MKFVILNPGPVAEGLFERYLGERGYSWRREPADLGTKKRPDYLVDADGRSVVCEVKALNTAGVLAAARGEGPFIGARNMKELVAPLREDIKSAAAQLKDLQDRDWPLVVVLSNPFGFLVPTDPKSVMAAMYGDFELGASQLEDGSLGEFSLVAGRNGRLTTHHAYLSAVAMLRVSPLARAWSDQWIAEHRAQYEDASTLTAALLRAARVDAPLGEVLSLDVIETVSPTATPLPRDIFNGPGDRRFVANDEGSGFIQLSEPGGR
ncbi:hypothetical protein [Amycolatopsis sp. NPDC051128]|uniref:hypothetical protein n=1 Tax=Amycolatopsis sp. NPDC051128 TaxID=3155412 RepID=UPI00343CC176